jgi:hypothetical protein
MDMLDDKGKLLKESDFNKEDLTTLHDFIKDWADKLCDVYWLEDEYHTLRNYMLEIEEQIAEIEEQGEMITDMETEEWDQVFPARPL